MHTVNSQAHPADLVTFDKLLSAELLAAIKKCYFEIYSVSKFGFTKIEALSSVEKAHQHVAMMISDSEIINRLPLESLD